MTTRGAAAVGEEVPRRPLDALSHDERSLVSLRDELDALGRAFASATTLRVDLHALGEAPAGAPRLLIAEAVRELLNNASFHAYGFPVALTARSTAELMQVVVHNDGPGVIPRGWNRPGRASTIPCTSSRAAGGSYEIRSSPGSTAGTTVTLIWPASVSGVRGRITPGRVRRACITL